MTDFTIVDNTDELYDVIKRKKDVGYLETELTIISKSKLHLDDLHGSQMTLIATSGSFSDRMSKLLTGEDGEEAVLAHYNHDLSEEEKEKYKQAIVDDHIVVVAKRDDSSHKEVEKRNSAYEELDITHYAAESEGPKS